MLGMVEQSRMDPRRQRSNRSMLYSSSAPLPRQVNKDGRRTSKSKPIKLIPHHLPPLNLPFPPHKLKPPTMRPSSPSNEPSLHPRIPYIVCFAGTIGCVAEGREGEKTEEDDAQGWWFHLFPGFCVVGDGGREGANVVIRCVLASPVIAGYVLSSMRLVVCR